MDNIFWIYDPCILFQGQNYYRVLPMCRMNRVTVLNKLSRLCFYVLILTLLFARPLTYALIPLVVIIIIIIVYLLLPVSVPSTTQHYEDITPDPVTTQPETDPIKWIYRLPAETCKENTARCYPYEDVRYQR